MGIDAVQLNLDLAIPGEVVKQAGRFFQQMQGDKKSGGIPDNPAP